MCSALCDAPAVTSVLKGRALYNSTALYRAILSHITGHSGDEKGDAADARIGGLFSVYCSEQYER